MELTPDWWDGPLAEDHHVYLRSQEKLLLYYHTRSPQLGNRRYLVDWLAIICDDYDICPTARHLMIALLDYFMDNHVISDQHLRLAALAAFLIACKFEEVESRIPKKADLNKYNAPQTAFTAKEFLEMEFKFLLFFNWHISFPTSMHFFDYFFVDGMAATDLSSWGSVGYEKAKLYLTKYAIYFLEISLQDYTYRCSLPSLVCAAAIAAARICLKMRLPWPMSLQKRTCYQWSDIYVLVDKMLTTHKQEEQASSQSQPEISESSNHSTGSSIANTPESSNPESIAQAMSEDRGVQPRTYTKAIVKDDNCCEMVQERVPI